MENEITETIEEPVQTEEVTQENVTQAQTEIPLKEAKVEVNGQIFQINERQLKALWGLPENEQLSDKEFKTMVSSYKAQKTSDIATKSARQQEKLVKEIAEMIQNDPWTLLQRAGYNPRELAEQYLTQAIEEEMMPENERELKKIRLEKEELERQYKEELSRREREQMDIAVQQAEKEITYQIIDAMESSKLPKTPNVIRRIATYMMLAEQKGIAVTPKQVLPLVEEDYKGLNSEIIKAMDATELLGYLGEDILKLIREQDLARLKRPTNNTQLQSQPKPKQNTNKKITKEEWRRELAERIKN